MSNQTLPNDQNDRYKKAIKAHENALRTIWLGMRDSNPRSWNQNPLPYHLANPH
jgi:hypothetical protein